VSIVGAATGASLSHPPPAVNIVGDIVFDFGFVAAAIYVASLSGGMRRAASASGAPRFGARVVGIVALAALCYFIATDVYASLLGLHGREQLPTGLGSTSDTAAMIGVGVFVTVIAPICEEFFFRGFLFGVLRSWLAPRAWGTWVAAIITGILFGAAHISARRRSKYLLPARVPRLRPVHRALEDRLAVPRDGPALDQQCTCVRESTSSTGTPPRSSRWRSWPSRRSPRSPVHSAARGEPAVGADRAAA
jgi:membrane protease YdiL (CAAX protease family)